MSEFTEGILFTNPHEALVQAAAQALGKPYIIHRLNDQWSGLFVDFHYTEREQEHAFLSVLSMKCPVMRFQNAEDHGWGYKIYHEGKVVASVEVEYELKAGFALDIAEARNPEIDGLFALMEESELLATILEEVEQSHEYHKRRAAQFQYKNTAAFKLFQMSDTIIEELEQVLVPANAGDLWSSENEVWDLHDQVERFKELVNIREMEWMRYRYLKNQP